jgi:hypothetical protein
LVSFANLLIQLTQDLPCRAVNSFLGGNIKGIRPILYSIIESLKHYGNMDAVNKCGNTAQKA